MINRREFDALVKRVDFLDNHGTRGVQFLQDKITDLIEKITEMNTKLEQHEKEHKEQQRSRELNKRWLITTIISICVIFLTVAGIILSIRP